MVVTMEKPKRQRKDVAKERALLKKYLIKAEIKRVNEKISKKEMCNAFGIHYQFYMNSLSDRNLPSKNMVDSLTEYLNTPTERVYEKVFAGRERELAFHEALIISEEEENSFMQQLKDEGIFKEPRA